MSARAVFTRTAAAAALLAIPLGLSACGGGGTTATSSTGTTSSSSTTSSSGSTPPAADNTGKPSRAAATRGMTKILQSGVGASGPSPAQLDKIATCIVDKTYDKLTVKTLTAMAAGNDKTNPDDADKPDLSAALTYCSKAAGVPSSSSTSG